MNSVGQRCKHNLMMQGMGEYEPRNFLQACLLLLLRERPAHGYDLLERLQTLRKDANPGGVYRLLRELEYQGVVNSGGGPLRLVHRGASTPSPRRAARAWRGRLMHWRGAHDELHAFLERCARAGQAEMTC